MQRVRACARTILTAVIFTFASLPAIGHAEGGSADQVNRIVTAMLEAYGGKDAVAAVQSVVARGTISDFMRDKQGDYARYYARPQRLRIEIMPDKGGEVRILDGSQGWQGSPGAFREARPVTLQSMVYQYAYLDMPMGFADKRYTATYGGTRDFRGRQVDQLTVELAGAQKLRIYIDPDRRLMVRVAADFDMGMGSSELSTEYEDFRPVGKVLFPFRLINYAGEMKLSVISLSDIQVNADIPREKFSPGKAKGSSGDHPEAPAR